jgi:hypothetical protein
MEFRKWCLWTYCFPDVLKGGRPEPQRLVGSSGAGPTAFLWGFNDSPCERAPPSQTDLRSDDAHMSKVNRH